ncbi:DNA helicase PcrA [Winkia sp. ACRQY]|uniref:DNA helicase PcrA n=1 Tax=unclassified Winkia TaxID=2692119 RepID=UPI0008A618EA|nr:MULTISPECIES: DNA helicase PcrA [unclassified Winkia]MCG7302993.1 DNA helicase PcrA [Winkia sp. ACRQY]OFT38328.1 ATP-dependent DNA helicase PcrA [Actinomyces sp. HMSC08A01]PMC92780.1 DNA helicase PcrA [Actinomyces sp. UMB0918]MDK8225469.1 DNA helicase PcrA [Winkia sp. UMB750B]MDK8257395.1 DNA helicase PcrA [Winkia sp. UMB750A]
MESLFDALLPASSLKPTAAATLPQVMVESDQDYMDSLVQMQAPEADQVGEYLPSMQAEQITQGLNGPQEQAVTYQGGPLLVMAGAGSGKTRVLTRRIAYLLATGRARAGQILAITFTNKAAAEMRERVQDLVGPAAKRMWVSTFHSACVRILRREHDLVGLKSTFSIYDSADQQRLLTLIAKEKAVDLKKFSARTLSARISDLKNELITPSQYQERAGKDPLSRIVAQIYPLYQKRMQEANAVDFDDLIMLTVQLLGDNEGVASHYRRVFRHILVDEYQDTNHAQYVLVKLLVGPDGATPPPAELTVVGDSDQSIYAFRGATIRNIEEFEKDYPKARTILLEQNYRSTQNILSAANAVIAQNSGRRPKKLWTDLGSGDKIVVDAAESDRGEAIFVVDQINKLADEGYDWGDIAVFYRTNAQSRIIEDVLMRDAIPYRVVGGTKFYERAEIKDAIAYLRAVSNPDDTVSIRRVLNVPRRGIGAKAEGAIAAHASADGISFGAALEELDQVEGISTRAANSARKFAELLAAGRSRLEDGEGVAEVLDYLLDESGYVQVLSESSDPRDEGRIENLAELHTVASEFDLSEPDGTLADFLERVSLVADSDQVPSERGQVTLMTVHTAKGLEFPVVFVTGMEDGTFPHQRSMGDPAELAEERRLAYVAITRARKRLYLTRAGSRNQWGAPVELPASRFLDDIPAELVDVRREFTPTQSIARSGDAFGSGGWNPSHRAGTVRTNRMVPKAAKPAGKEIHLEVGDLVNHDAYGLGRVLALEGNWPNTTAKVDFGDGTVKRLVLRFAPLEKL